MSKVKFESNYEDAVKTLRNLNDEIPKGVNNAAEKLSNEFVKASKKEMKTGKRRNVVTGQGLESFDVIRKKADHYAVVSNSYLNVLDKGRSSGSRPDTTNERFRAAARQYGMDVNLLADVIEKKGTEAYPWIRPVKKKIERNAPKRVKIELERAVKESQSSL